MIEKPKLQELVLNSFTKALEGTLCVCSGTAWHAETADGVTSEPMRWMLFSLESAMRGHIAFGFDPTLGTALAGALLGTPGSPHQSEDEEREATSELMRQIGGELVSRLRSDVGEVSVTLSESSNPLEDAQFFPLALEREGFTGVAMLAIGSDLQWSSPEPTSTGDPLPSNLELLLDVQLAARLRFGSRRMKLRELLQTQAGAVIELDRMVQEPVDLLIDSKLVARGEVVIVEGNYGLRIKEVMTTQQRAGLIR